MVEFSSAIQGGLVTEEKVTVKLAGPVVTLVAFRAPPTYNLPDTVVTGTPYCEVCVHLTASTKAPVGCAKLMLILAGE